MVRRELNRLIGSRTILKYLLDRVVLVRELRNSDPRKRFRSFVPPIRSLGVSSPHLVAYVATPGMPHRGTRPQVDRDMKTSAEMASRKRSQKCPPRTAGRKLEGGLCSRCRVCLFWGREKSAIIYITPKGTRRRSPLQRFSRVLYAGGIERTASTLQASPEKLGTCGTRHSRCAATDARKTVTRSPLLSVQSRHVGENSGTRRGPATGGASSLEIEAVARSGGVGSRRGAAEMEDAGNWRDGRSKGDTRQARRAEGDYHRAPTVTATEWVSRCQRLREANGL
ncbi:hypothetical protein MRX96_008348 [Rhipicephalus microplus]